MMISSSALPSAVGVIPTVTPSYAPVRPPQTIPATPYNIEYEISEIVTEVDDAEAALNTTLLYLADFLIAEFEMASTAQILRFDGLYDNFLVGPPPVGSLTTEVTFAGSSMIIPSTAELDVLVERAFQEPAVQELIERLQTEMDPDNPLSQTTAVTYFI
jgi:hypothetical protein